MSFAVSFQGVGPASPAFFAAGTASVSAPSNFGRRLSKASTPSRSARMARSPGSMLRWRRVALPSALGPEEMRNG
ncbi:hypothetical protein ABIF50_008428 [Bradyrhizobium diazoefficiens]